MALLQYFNGSPAEEQLYACMKSLARFTQISGQDVPQLIQMIGPEPNKFRGTSERIDEQIDQKSMLEQSKLNITLDQSTKESLVISKRNIIVKP
ncbi:unnamed protein product [Heterotrigona itama]|uniref:Uncharacterized protein n=1 Tax=Heterotrigona itama TaxID=395501 RepID=A0A6V7H1Z8_9HYME|nr:unnamed protein product [Heterotrigona itama]